MRCLIIDDEPLALELIEDNLKHIESLKLIASCRSASTALQILQEQPVDLIFSDIQMPGINGLQLVRSLPVKPMVIFISAYQEFAIEGFELDVVDYLLKPVPLDRFLKACNKALSMHELKNRTIVSQPTQKDHLFLYSEYDLVRINHDDINYIEGLKDYVKIHCRGSEKAVMSRITIKALEEQLPANKFFRTHKSFIVNLAYVQSLRKGRIKLGSAEIPYSDNYKGAVSRMVGRTL